MRGLQHPIALIMTARLLPVRARAYASASSRSGAIGAAAGGWLLLHVVHAAKYNARPAEREAGAAGHGKQIRGWRPPGLML